MRKKTYKLTDQVGHLLRKAYQRHIAIFQQKIDDPQLTAAQFATLCAINDHGNCSMSEIIKVTSIDQATIRGVIDRLRQRRLISVFPDPDDRRKANISLTKEGQALVDKAIPRAAEITQLTFRDLNDAERVAMIYLLRKMTGEEGEASG